MCTNDVVCRGWSLGDRSYETFVNLTINFDVDKLRCYEEPIGSAAEYLLAADYLQGRRGVTSVRLLSQYLLPSWMCRSRFSASNMNVGFASERKGWRLVLLTQSSKILEPPIR